MRCLVVTFLLPVSAALGPALTDWQTNIFREVEKSAAEQSKAAEPKLLALLASDNFRAGLKSCCPSLAQLPARELLDRLSKQMEVVEVASGFPAFEDPAKVYPDAAGMSIAFGLKGSVFLNDWQAVLKYVKDPKSVWNAGVSTYMSLEVDLPRNQVSVAQWKGGCNGTKTPPMTYVLGKCYALPDGPSGNITAQYNYQKGKVTTSVWMANNKEGQKGILHGMRAALQPVPCPTASPLDEQVYNADGQCHGYAQQNNSDGFVNQDHAETFEYGLKPFHIAGAPENLSEADERPAYSMVNLNLIDLGSPIYGDVSAIFASKYIAKSTLLSPVDSGYVGMKCLKGHDFPWARHSNCSAVMSTKPYTRNLGTLQYNKHLFMINEDFWQGHGILQTAFLRMEGSWGANAVPGGYFLNYLEGALLGKLEYPSAIRFLIGAFPTLFGTELGVQLQNWARSRGWVLVWALGPNDKAVVEATSDFDFDLMTSHTNFSVNQRILDPTVLSHTGAAASLALQADVTDKFQQAWAQVGMLRKQTQHLTNSTTAQKWQEMAGLLPSLRLRPLMGGDCEEQIQAAECVGVTLDGRCVCYESSKVASTEAIVV